MKAFEQDVNCWERQLSQMLEVTEMILTVQRQWMDLEVYIFIRSWRVWVEFWLHCCFHCCKTYLMQHFFLGGSPHFRKLYQLSVFSLYLPLSLAFYTSNPSYVRHLFLSFYFLFPLELFPRKGCQGAAASRVQRVWRHQFYLEKHHGSTLSK